MKKNPFLMRVVVVSIIAIIIWLFWPSIPHPITTANEYVIKPSQIKTINLPAKIINQSIPLAVKIKNITS